MLLIYAGASIDPDLLLAVFLPALLFESSFSMEVHQIKVSFLCLLVLVVLSFGYWKFSLVQFLDLPLSLSPSLTVPPIQPSFHTHTHTHFLPRYIDHIALRSTFIFVVKEDMGSQLKL
jgi:hypothetical protein